MFLSGTFSLAIGDTFSRLCSVSTRGDVGCAQYYGEVLSKKPVELHRFYKDESTFCHASGTKEEVHPILARVP